MLWHFPKLCVIVTCVGHAERTADKQLIHLSGFKGIPSFFCLSHGNLQSDLNLLSVDLQVPFQKAKGMFVPVLPPVQLSNLLWNSTDFQ